MVNNNLSVLYGYKDTKPQRYWSHDLDLLRSSDVIGHVTIGPLESCVQPMLRAKSLLRMPGVT